MRGVIFLSLIAMTFAEAGKYGLIPGPASSDPTHKNIIKSYYENNEKGNYGYGYPDYDHNGHHGPYRDKYYNGLLVSEYYPPYPPQGLYHPPHNTNAGSYYPPYPPTPRPYHPPYVPVPDPYHSPYYPPPRPYYPPYPPGGYYPGLYRPIGEYPGYEYGNRPIPTPYKSHD